MPFLLMVDIYPPLHHLCWVGFPQVIATIPPIKSTPGDRLPGLVKEYTEQPAFPQTPSPWISLVIDMVPSVIGMILLMEEILHHLACKKTCK